MEQFERSIQIMGEDAFERLQHIKVILFGVGGVGGWCAEVLVRTGVQHLTIVDFDTINISNLNRQLVATSQNIGQPKVDELRKRLLAINPRADIIARNERYSKDTAENFDLAQYDYVIDAIDSVDDKLHLIYNTLCIVHRQPSTTLFSSMGAGRKLDCSQIRVSEFWKVEGCPLARALRTRMKKAGLLPASKFQCVWSPEISADAGTLASVVGVFGMQLANLVIKDLISRHQPSLSSPQQSLS